MESFRVELFFVALAAALAPLLVQMPARFRVPAVVVEILLGILLGPHLLNLVSPEGFVGTLGELGLTFLLFMVGMEIDIVGVPRRPLTMAFGGWCLSFAVAMITMAFVHEIGLIQMPPLLAAVALSTTALGIIVPILREDRVLESEFGQQILYAAAMGELGPLLVISLLLIHTYSTVIHALLMMVFVIVAVGTAYGAIKIQSSKWFAIFADTMQSSGQLPVRICIVVQALLVALAAEFGLNVVIGAFVAGMVVGLVSKGEAGAELRHKLDAIGYGFLIPIYFVVAGMKFDVSALWASPLVPVQIISLLILMVVVRGAPILLYGKVLAAQDRVPFALYSATGLPLIVVITEFGVDSGLMPAARGAVLLCAAMISVILFPIMAKRMRHQMPMIPWDRLR